jgi:hypothetical protein
MEAVGDLLRLWCSQRRPFGVQAATIPRDGLDFRVLLQPGGEALSGSIREQVYDKMQVKVYQDRSIILAFAPSPIIDPQVVNRSGRCFRRLFSDAPENRIITGGDRQSGQ